MMGTRGRPAIPFHPHTCSPRSLSVARLAAAFTNPQPKKAHRHLFPTEGLVPHHTLSSARVTSSISHTTHVLLLIIFFGPNLKLCTLVKWLIEPVVRITPGSG